MTEFKQGDRVRYNGKSTRFANTSKVGETGVVVEVESSGDVGVRWDNDPSYASTHYDDNLELVDVEPKVGDRVRVVYEGRVVSTNETLGDVRVFTDTGHSILTGSSATSVEVLERAPKAYPVGTVAIGCGSTYVQLADGTVRAVYGDGTTQILSKALDFWGKVVHEPATA